MNVIFTKTGDRRYGVIIRRDGFPDLEMNPAPGFDSLMPHDLLHFLVERELGLKNGIYGQIANGGTAGTFHVKTSDKSNNREESRARRKILQRGKKLLKDGLDDCAQSERATYICLHDWYFNSNDENLKARAEQMKDSAQSVYGQMTESEKASLNKKLVSIRNRMDELSRKWSALRLNESISLEW